MKVYWSEGVGCVVTSANLSINALGIGDLKEAGVLLAPESEDVDKLIGLLQLRPALPELHTLDLAHRDYYKRNRHTSRRGRVSFADWYISPNPEPWKIEFAKNFAKIQFRRS